MTVGWAFLGTGRHADRDVLPEMVDAAGTRLVAVLSRDKDRGKIFAEKHGFQRVYDRLEDFLEDPEVDAIYDSTPDGLHADYTIQAAEAGKHILVEKSLGITAAQCRRSVEICAKLNVKLGAAFQERYQSVQVEARELVRSGKMGDAILARVQLAWAGPERRADQRAGTGCRPATR